MNEDNIILMTDSYKVSHWKQYPVGTEKVYSYLEARIPNHEVVFFGLQYLIKKYLIGQVVSYEKIAEAREFYKAHFGSDEIFNIDGWLHIANYHNGVLPVEIKAVAEGSIHPTRTVLLTIENTCNECFWVTNYLETLLSQLWYPCTVASQSDRLRTILSHYLEKTGSDPADFKLHDFGYRGSTSQESSAIGAAAHLLSFMGTDTVSGLRLLQKYYGGAMAGFSIPAAEHSTITSWGKDNELLAFENMLIKFPEGLVAVVSDSYDIYAACKDLWGGSLKKKILSRKGTLVIRPDSGNPLIVLPRVLDILAERFGYTTNEKGYKVLPPTIRLIQGDGITEESLLEIIDMLVEKGWSLDNLAFGSGGGLLQKMNRDTLRFAFKCSNITIYGVDFPVKKDPITDSTKASKAGRFDNEDLKTVFKDGNLLITTDLEKIRERIRQ